MTTDEEHRRRYSEAIRGACRQGADAFQSWFDTTTDEADALRRGHWDFALHILTPKVCELLSEPGSLTALEIGYGGGRLLNAAAAFFGHVKGVDIHDEQEAVRALLDRLGRTNTELLRGSGDIPVTDESVDFVYSFIVLQHLPRFDAFIRYMRETFRVLRPGGIAQLYYGRLSSRDPRVTYIEIEGEPNDMSLVMTPRAVRGVCRKAGLRVVDSGASYKRVPDGYRDSTGAQSYVTLVKPAAR